MNVPTKPTLNAGFSGALPDLDDRSTWKIRSYALWEYEVVNLPQNMTMIANYNAEVVEYIDTALAGAETVIDSVAALNEKFTPVLEGIMSSAAGGKLQLYGSGDARINGHKIWHAGNDGAGSGLDADKLDGLSSGSFVRSDTNDTISGNNYYKGLTYLSRPASEQAQIGRNTGASRDAYMSWWDGQNTRRGYIQAQSYRMRIVRDGGAALDLYGSGDVRINGGTILHSNTAWNGKGSEVTAFLTSGSVVEGNTVSGSRLLPSSCGGKTRSSSSLAGTWLALGRADSGASDYEDRTTTYRKIS